MDDLWATKSEDVGLILAQLVSKIFNLFGNDPPTSLTDRRADRQTTCDSKTVLCTIRRVSNLAPPPELQMLQSFQLQGVLELLPPDFPLAAYPLGALPQTPIIAL